MTQSHDIETVLSSIRQLVAVETGGTRAAAPKERRSQGSPLVLSETDRVDGTTAVNDDLPTEDIEQEDKPGLLILTRDADAHPDPDASRALSTGSETLPEPVDASDSGIDDASMEVTLAGTVPYGTSERAEINPDHQDGPPSVDPPDRTSAPVDIEAIRSMIAEVVAQELNGELGERITRNVRKMVQHEIRNAMADLERK